MKKLLLLVNFLTLLHFILCRDFYMGMFNRDDYLVAQDNLYKEKRPYTRVTAEYGRLFKCPISYFRVVDRLGMGPGPVVKILKGGLRKNYISIRLRSGYNLPISVNIYVGCHNTEPRRPIRPTRPTSATTEAKTEKDSITSESATDAARAATTDLGEAVTDENNEIDSTKASSDNPNEKVADDENTKLKQELKKKKSKDNQHNTIS